MSDIAVRARNLKKSYTLYSTPWDRMREIIGFKRKAGTEFPEHVAVDGIDIDISCGEKVAFIGRNGAGKSTLLKLITGVIEPTEGELEINGQTHALLQMGAGFHQDFTGRENARGYLANLGVSGGEVDRLIDDIIEFSELEEYIDQPFKTYSTGMQMRLVFAASTTIAPKLFVVDEVLGVGDAYFQQKSFARIEEMCERNQTTLLLVSHDIYTAAKICDRMIWIDRGRIKFDGDAKTALNLYESSIKEQEEQRLRRKATLVSTSSARAGRAGSRVILIELRPAEGQLGSRVDIKKAEIIDQVGGVVASLAPGRGGVTRNAIGTDGVQDVAFETVDDGSNWHYEERDGRGTKIALSSHGSVFQKGVLKAEFPVDSGRLSATLVLQTKMSQSIIALVFGDDQRLYKAANVDLAADRQQTVSIPLGTEGLEEYIPDPAASVNTRHGSGGIRFATIDILDANGKSTRQLKQGESYVIEFGYELADPDLADRTEMMIAIARDGVLDCMRAFNEALRLSPSRKSGIITYAIETLPLANGRYVLSVLVSKRGYYGSVAAASYTLNDDVYDVLSRAIEFVVSEQHPAFNGTIVRGSGAWKVG